MNGKNDPLARADWDRAARTLAARLGLDDHSVRSLTARIASAMWRRWYYRHQPNMINPAIDVEYRVEDVLDALALIRAARYAVNVDERDLITAARHLGASWERIGVAIGAKPSGARQTARGRYERLGGDVRAAVAGAAAEEAPQLVDPGERVPAPVPADDWPLPGEDRPGAARAVFVEVPLLDDEADA